MGSTASSSGYVGRAHIRSYELTEYRYLDGLARVAAQHELVSLAKEVVYGNFDAVSHTLEENCK